VAAEAMSGAYSNLLWTFVVGYAPWDLWSCCSAVWFGQTADHKAPRAALLCRCIAPNHTPAVRRESSPTFSRPHPNLHKRSTPPLTIHAGGFGGGAAAAAHAAPFAVAEDIRCPICVELISDPFVTPCGHTFCFNCISTHLRTKNSCPSCSAFLVQDNIHPNFLLDKV